MTITAQFEKQRRSSRVRMALPVQLITDGVSQPTCTLDVSIQGARICNLHSRPVRDAFVVLERGEVRSSYRVVWIEDEPGRTSWQAGLECMDPEHNLFRAIQKIGTA